jgi:hypothetical protein
MRSSKFCDDYGPAQTPLAGQPGVCWAPLSGMGLSARMPCPTALDTTDFGLIPA